MSIQPLGMDRPMAANKYMRYLLLKDDQSLSIVDTVLMESKLIAHTYFDRSQSCKYGLPAPNSFILGPPKPGKTNSFVIYCTEDAWQLRMIEYAQNFLFEVTLD